MLDQVRMITERVLDSVIRYEVDIDNMQFGFMPGHDTAKGIFILCRLIENCYGSLIKGV